MRVSEDERIDWALSTKGMNENPPGAGVHAPVGPGLQEAHAGVGPEVAEGRVQVQHRHRQGHGARHERHAHQAPQLLGLLVWPAAGTKTRGPSQYNII